MEDIFLSYRRSDSATVAGRIFDKLTEKFGEERLFKDVDSIPLGEDFRTVIANVVGRCKVLLVVIGDDWNEAEDANGNRRIDDPNDFVHIEIATAITRRIPVIPLLVGNASMPRFELLPAPLQPLAFRNGIKVRPDPDFHNDMARLCQQLSLSIESKPEKRVTRTRKRRARRIAVWIIAGFCVALLVGVGLYGISPRRPGAPNEPSLRYWIKKVPTIPGENADRLFVRALASWQAQVDVSMSMAKSESEANVIIVTDARSVALSDVGPPNSDTPVLTIRFGPQVTWNAHTFQAASCRMIGQTLGLRTFHSRDEELSETVPLDELPIMPQPKDYERVREIWKTKK